jgi:hypothetical protein
MRLTPGERRALWCLVPVFAAFLPPVTLWVAGVRERVFGLPFLLLWNAASVAATAGWVLLALRIKDRTDGRASEEPGSRSGGGHHGDTSGGGGR